MWNICDTVALNSAYVLVLPKNVSTKYVNNNKERNCFKKHMIKMK